MGTYYPLKDEVEQRLCKIGLKSGNLPSGHHYGCIFDDIESCCDEFKNWFLDTGNRKRTSFDLARDAEKDGFNLTIRGCQDVVVIKTISPAREDRLRYCPFCGAEIEIKVTKVVELRDKFKEVRDGYEEVVVFPKPETDTKTSEKT